MKFTKWVEDLLFLLTPAIVVLLDLADTFGWFHIFPDGSTPALTLLVCALIMGVLAAIQRKLVKVLEHLQLLLAQRGLDILKSIPGQIDKNLLKVLKDDYFQDIIYYLHMALKDHQALVHDTTRFRHYYARMLKVYPRSTFLVSCPLDSCCIWQDAALQKITNSFLQSSGGSKIKMVLIARDAQEMASPEAQAILKQLKQTRIEYYVLDGTAVPTNLKKAFIVESKGIIAWELLLDGKGNLEGGLLTANMQTTAIFTSTFEKLWDSELHKKRKGP